MFRAKGAKFIKIVPPYIATVRTCGRWGGLISLGRYKGKPFLAREEGGLDVKIIQIASWKGQSWTATCGVEVRFVPVLIPQGPVCHAADCAGAVVAAKHIAAQAQADAQHVPDEEGDNLQLDHLLNLAAHTPGTTEVPFSPELDEPGFIFYLGPYMATVDGHPTLALVNTWQASPSFGSNRIGYAVAFWQEIDGKLVPVAGFHLRAGHSGIKSVWVTR